VKILLAVAAAVAIVVLPERANRSQAGDGAPPARKAATAKAARASPPAASERELLKQIQKTWRKREERVHTLLLLYVTKVTDGPERARWRRDMAEQIKKRPAAPAKEAGKVAVKNGRPLPIKLAEPYSLQLFAVRGKRAAIRKVGTAFGKGGPRSSCRPDPGQRLRSSQH
jgi:hypothetical protein